MRILPRSAKHKTDIFIDKVRIYARGGRGGQGSSRLGSVGGKGGEVCVCAAEGSNLRDITRLESRRFVAGIGGHGERSNANGRKGNGVVISVPPGTVVYDQEEKEVCDLTQTDTKTVLVKGGDGGNHMTPNWHGLPGQQGIFIFKLKSIAEVGLVGLPNAGKSTLLGVLSKATPQVASYPFTTLQPQIGTVCGHDGTSVSVADLPGLVEGAHNNVGRGHKFLQHIERTSVLLYVVDIMGFQLSRRHTMLDPYNSVCVLVDELESYCPGLAHNRKSILALNKMDTPQAHNHLQVLLQRLKERSPVDFHSIIGCSALSKTGTEAIRSILLSGELNTQL